MPSAPEAAKAPPPLHADATRGEHRRRLWRSTPVVLSAALATGAALVAGAALGGLTAALVAPVVVVLICAGLVFAAADRRAAQDFFTAYAGSIGFVITSDADVPPLTPLLGAGDDRSVGHWMEGSLDGTPCGLGHFTYEEHSTDSKGNRTTTSYAFTTAVLDLESSIRLFHGVYVQPRSGWFGTNWYAWGTKKIELESVAFNERYDLLVEDEQDANRIRQLLSPSLIVWLAEHPLDLGFELRAGTLVVFVEKHLDEAGRLTFFLDAAREVARRVRAQVEQEA